MTSLGRSDSLDTTGGKVDGEPPMVAEKATIRLEPARTATARQESVGNDDVASIAGCGEFALLDP